MVPVCCYCNDDLIKKGGISGQEAEQQLKEAQSELRAAESRYRQMTNRYDKFEKSNKKRQDVLNDLKIRVRNTVVKRFHTGM